MEQKQIDEIVKIITKEYPNKFGVSHPAKAIRVAYEILKYYQPKIPENAVVLTREEHIQMLKDLAESNEIAFTDAYRRSRVQTAERLAEMLKAEAHYTVCGTRCVSVSRIDEICKEITEGKV